MVLLQISDCWWLPYTEVFMDSKISSAFFLSIHLESFLEGLPWGEWYDVLHAKSAKDFNVSQLSKVILGDLNSNLPYLLTYLNKHLFCYPPPPTP